jgi:hypothetical protein
MVKHMDRLEKRLKDDAELIQAEVSPEMQERLRAALESTRQDRSIRPKRKLPGISLWLASSLTGLAAAVLIIVLVNLNSSVEPIDSGPKTVVTIPDDIHLDARTAEWTAPLEEELKNLQSDLEKARDNVERDLRSSF